MTFPLHVTGSHCNPQAALMVLVLVCYLCCSTVGQPFCLLISFSVLLSCNFSFLTFCHFLVRYFSLPLACFLTSFLAYVLLFACLLLVSCCLHLNLIPHLMFCCIVVIMIIMMILTMITLILTMMIITILIMMIMLCGRVLE